MNSNIGVTLTIKVKDSLPLATTPSQYCAMSVADYEDEVRNAINIIHRALEAKSEGVRDERIAELEAEEEAHDISMIYLKEQNEKLEAENLKLKNTIIFESWVRMFQ